MTSQVENLWQTYGKTYDNFMTNRKIFLVIWPLASFIVQVSMWSSDVMLSVCLLSWTNTLIKCKLLALSVLMPLNSGMSEVLQDLYGLLSTWPVPLHRRTACNAYFSLWAALFWTTKQYIQVYWDESLSKSQSESAEEKPLVHNSRLSETNVKD